MDKTICRFKSQFEYIYYNGTNKNTIEQNLRIRGYDTMKVDGLENMPAIIFTKYDKGINRFKTDVSVIEPEQYVIFYDTDQIGLMTKPEFESTFELVEEDKNE